MMDDFKVPEHELAEAITSIFGLEKDAPEKKANKYYYQVRIVIGEPFGAGMAGDGAYIRLIGDKAQSEKAAVKKDWDFFDRHLSRTYSDMTIETDKDLGDILVVSLGIKKDWLPSLKYWYVDYVMVDNQQSKKKKQFPCYHWIGDGDSVSVTANTATLQQVANNPIYLQQRQSQLDKRRKQYVWKWFRDVGLPSGIDATVLSLPLDEEFWAGKLMDFTGTAVKDAVVMGFQKHITNIEEKLFSVDDLSIFEQLAKALGKHEFPVYQAGRWTRDEEFGYQMLNGVNPVVIKQCTAKPANFPVKTEMVRGSLNRGLTLEEEMKAGNVYICDLKVMDGLPCRENYYCPAPLCLLYVNGYSKLVPIAIQLKQVPGDDNPIFLPSDHWIDWLLAKIFYQSAHSQYHELAVHYLSCHAAMEAYAMGIMRNLPDPHPLYKLLRPHIRYTMAINTAARASLINDGGIIDRAFAIGGEGRKELMRRAGKAYSIYWTNIKRSAKKRGVDDTNQLLEYYYRNDGFKIWQAIESYAHDIIYEFYSSDSAVANDQELQYCVTDIHNNGFPGYDGGVQGHGFPKQVDTRDDLVELCTLIMFTGSAQHASVNFGQYDYYGYVPNAPFGVRSPPPTKKGVADYQTLLDTLPDKNTACLSISIAHLLSQYGPKERFLGHYPSERFTEEKAQRMIERFKKSLDGITGDIEERNKSLDVPYVFMLPGRVPNSITI